MTTLSEQMGGTTFEALAGRYLVARLADGQVPAASDFVRHCFALFRDPADGELTAIAEEPAADRFRLETGREIHRGYRIIRFNLLVPFEGVGFIATLSRAIADRGINLLAASAYSFDYILVKEDDLPSALEALRGLGMREGT